MQSSSNSVTSNEELASHSIRANHQLISDIIRIKDAVEASNEHMPGLSGLIKKDGSIIRANFQTAHAMGFGRENLFGLSLSEKISEESWKMMTFAMSNGNAQDESVEASIETPQGTRIYLWKFRPFSWVSARRGEVFSFHATDITERKNFEQKVASFFSSIPLGILTIGSDRKVAWPYSAFAEILLDRHELEGLSAEEAVFAKAKPHMTTDQVAGIHIFLDMIGSDPIWFDVNKQALPQEIGFIRGDSTAPDFWLGIMYSPIIENGSIKSFLLILEDITERVLKRQDQSNSKSKEQLIAEIIFDLESAGSGLIATCSADLQSLFQDLNKHEATGGSVRSVCNTLHGIKGVSRIMNLRAFKDRVHALEERFLADENGQDAALQPWMISEMRALHAAWLEISRYINVFKSPDINVRTVYDESHRRLAEKRNQIGLRLKELTRSVPIDAAQQITHLMLEVSSLGREPLLNLELKLRSWFDQTARKLGKDAQLSFKWDEICVEPAHLQSLSEVFMHLINNALDHGIEPPEVRGESGKHKTAMVTIMARTVDRGVFFCFEDDGRGMNREALFKKALARGLQLDREKMQDEDILQLALLPGLTTKEEVTDTSGRGIGLDAIDEKIESFGGQGLKIAWSGVGKGTRFEFLLVQ
jgi:two-component system chemotaxis sensor kinase CheA